MGTSADQAAVRARVRGALLGTMVGDALGAELEGSAGTFAAFARQQAPAAAGPEQAVAGLRAWLGRGAALRYTDDTQMTLALAETLVEAGEVDAELLARKLVAHFDGACGYGAGAARVIELLAAGTPWNEANRAVFPDGSFGNGAAMRVAPVGALYFERPEALVPAAVSSALVTHAHPEGIEGAVMQAHCVSLALAAGLRGQPLRADYFLRALVGRVMTHGVGSELLQPLGVACRLVERGEPLDALRRAVGNGVRAVEAVPAALGVFLAAGGRAEVALGLALMLGGDSDTIAAMAGALAGAYAGEEALPAAALAALDAEPVGAGALRALADRLCELRLR